MPPALAIPECKHFRFPLAALRTGFDFAALRMAGARPSEARASLVVMVPSETGSCSAGGDDRAG